MTRNVNQCLKLEHTGANEEKQQATQPCQELPTDKAMSCTAMARTVVEGLCLGACFCKSDLFSLSRLPRVAWSSPALVRFRSLEATIQRERERARERESTMPSAEVLSRTILGMLQAVTLALEVTPQILRKGTRSECPWRETA